MTDVGNGVQAAVQAYKISGDLGTLLDALRAVARDAPPDVLREAAGPFRDMPEVVIPIYESILRRDDRDAQSIVILANAYWLTGRGADVVGQLAERAKTLDPSNRGAWHLWALAEPSVRGRVDRWRAVTQAFPSDQLARAALADNATSLANDEHDPVALKTAIDAYSGLLAEATGTAQRLALESTLKTLRGWSF